jgi:hypothetical protein
LDSVDIRVDRLAFKGRRIKFDHDRDLEARCGRVEGDPDIAHGAHLHPTNMHRRSWPEAADGIAEAHEERHPVRDASAGLPLRGFLTPPESILA